MKMRMLAGLLVGGLFLSPQAWADEVVEKMREHLAAGQFDAAYAVATQHADRIGAADFDILYGIAAIEAGRGGEGVLALERYRMTAPHDAQATLHLARGYLLLGELARARAELEALLAASPAPEVASAADALLDAARTQESAAAGSAKVYVEAGMGTDSNVNGGVGSSVVTLPVFGQIALPDGVTETGDYFTHLAAGAQATRALKPGLSVFGGVDFNTRLHANDDDYDQRGMGGHAGVTLNQGGTLWRATASHHTLWLENDRYRSVTGLAGEWATGVHPGGMFNTFVQYARFDYGAAGAGVRDADFVGVGAGYRRVFAGALRPTFALSLTFGDESNDRNREDYSRNLWGISGTVSVTPLPRLNLSATLMHQESQYGADDPLLLVTREDRFDSLTLGATYLIDRRLSVRGEIGYVDNYSNIALYKYDRLQGLVKLRYEF